jgi:hypothetical protein
MEGLKEWLIGNGYEIYSNQANIEGNFIDWYAAKRANSIRKCACNDKLPQIVVSPFSFKHFDTTYKSITVSISGERQGLWWKLESYALSPDTLIKNLGMIEESLIKAWEAL